MHTLTQYLQALENPVGLCRRLSGMELCRDEAGRPLFHVGNSAAVFKIRLGERTLRLRCYTRKPATDLAALYGCRYLPEELYLHTDDRHGEWVGVVVDDWVEGHSLDYVMSRAQELDDAATFAWLSARFDELAARLLTDDWAHGDLKPENILLDETGRLQLIDFDACFRPEMAGRCATELGTPAYQHPRRSLHDFDRWIDHYPAALLSTQLRALALDPSLAHRPAPDDGILFLPEEILRDTSALYREVLDLFARTGDGIHYRIARALQQPTYRLYGIEELFCFVPPRRCPAETPEFFIDEGLCGFRTKERITVPPVYDEAFDYREEWALVRLGKHRHYIDLLGRPQYHLPPCDGAQSLRNGCVRYRIGDFRISVKVK